MSTMTKPAAANVEQRILIPDVPYRVYETLIDAVSEHSPVRMAYDGKDLEIMTKGLWHEDYRGWFDPVIVIAAAVGGRKVRGLGETTWKRPELERGIEADQCYFLTQEKLDRVAAALKRKSNDLADYPNPDLVVEIDISEPKADREGIYAAMRVPELWVFDGEALVIKHLGPDGYFDAGRSQFLTIRPDEVVRWLLEEDRSDRIAWEDRLRAWASRELTGR
jgi:Uma2 family endonuclease